ncbi:berberine bridge enzyme-like 24 [Gossypium hirsutum]|uniref:Berberine bridge enzyme-like 24 n=1 Tax=Gossypium hirsutum TaxID=3635 RepID=A0A1U8L3E6_GOSHI|nr:berberine bridge enzyme-like 24 [Gossypium hirsutum]
MCDHGYLNPAWEPFEGQAPRRPLGAKRETRGPLIRTQSPRWRRFSGDASVVSSEALRGVRRMEERGMRGACDGGSAQGGQCQYYKSKSDYVKEPISETALNGLISRLTDEQAPSAYIIFMAYGGIIDRIPEDVTPFPHRAGNLYKIHYTVKWQEQDNVNSQRYIDWTRRSYRYMTPFVSKFPREAYVNYRDLDIGSNNVNHTSYAHARIWGRKYFKNYFDRLVQVKTEIDPKNFFRHEQSIPPFP